MDHSPPEEANYRTDMQETYRFLWKPKVCFSVPKSLLLVPGTD